MNLVAILLDSIKRRIEVEIASSEGYTRPTQKYQELVRAMRALAEDLELWSEMAKESEE